MERGQNLELWSGSEKKDEVLKTMDDMVEHGLHILTIGQYLQPTKMHIEVDDFITLKFLKCTKRRV